MFKKVKIVFMLMIVVTFTSVFSTSFDSYAALSDTNEFFVGYAEPTTNIYSGYVSVLLNNSNGKYSVETFFWTLLHSPDLEEKFDDCFITMQVICNSNRVTFTPIFEGSGIEFFEFQLAKFDSSEHLEVCRYGSYDLTSDVSYSFDYSPYGRVVGCTYGGNLSYCRGFGSLIPVMHWSDSVSAKELRNTLNSLLSKLNDIVDDTFWILNDIENIYNQNITTQQKIDQLISLQNQILAEEKESNTWLEKIFNFLEEKDEKDKEAATQQGSSSTSQGMNAIDDKGGDFANSLGGLTNSMSYSGTQCAWEFPEVKIPAIPGVMNEAVLIQRQPIDFSQWVNAIPSDILLVVQSFCTIGLIVYCFKELYNTIAYVLTLRRDDNE